MKNLTDKELKTASIIDLTDDLNVIREAMDDTDLTFDDIKQLNDTGKMMSLFNFAEHIEDKKLIIRLEKIFKDNIELIFNE